MGANRWATGLTLAAMAGGSFTATLLHYSRQWIAPPRVILEPPACDQAEEVHFTATDGTPLYGWLLRARPQDPTIVLCHGYQRSMEETFSLGCDLRDRGFNALVFDFRGCGRSGGRYTTLGYHEPHDLQGALQWLQARGLDRGGIGVLGVSMGGSVALMAAAQGAPVTAVVADSAFATLSAAVTFRLRGLRFPLRQLYVLTMRTAERLSGGHIDDVRPVDAARQLGDLPIFLIHSTGDDIVPYSHALELDAVIPGPHQLWTIDSPGHALGRFRAHTQYLTRVTDFFHQYLRAPIAVPA